MNQWVRPQQIPYQLYLPTPHSNLFFCSITCVHLFGVRLIFSVLTSNNVSDKTYNFWSNLHLSLFFVNILLQDKNNNFPTTTIPLQRFWGWPLCTVIHYWIVHLGLRLALLWSRTYKSVKVGANETSEKPFEVWFELYILCVGPNKIWHLVRLLESICSWTKRYI